MPYRDYWRNLFVLLLGLALGAGVFAGAMTAPVVFHANDYIPGGELSRFEMGSLMSELFVRLSWLVDISLVALLLNEALKLRAGERRLLGSGFSLLALLAGGLFGFYYLPQILAMQQLGPAVTGTPDFESLHAGSELWFKLYLLGVLGALLSTLGSKAR